MRNSNLIATHAWILPFLNNQESVVFDMTCGNGHDTLFLAQHAYHVYAVDIQAQALIETKKRTHEMRNITYLHQDHSSVDLSLIPKVHGAIYNLGYLPGGDKRIITQTETTIASLKRIVPHLIDFLVVTCYPGHPGGEEETEAVIAYLSSLKADMTQFTYDKPHSPIACCLRLHKL